MKNDKVDIYLSDGCGRCNLAATPNCKVNNWQQELIILRQIILDCGLVEELKWGVPCYTYDNKNLIILAAFKQYCSISFLNGALLSDANHLLSKPGENSQSARIIKFKNVQEIVSREMILKAYIFEAIELVKSGLKVELKNNSEIEFVPELSDILNKNLPLKKAFEKLTPGRQRGYNIYFSSAKQSKSRIARIEKNMQRIINGKGLNDCVCGLSKKMPSCDVSHKSIE